MSFLYDFATPRTKPVQFDTLASASSSAAGNLLHAVSGLFSSKKSTTVNSNPSAAVSSSTPVSFTDRIHPSNASHNLALATEARKGVQLALQTKRTVDSSIEEKRLPLLEGYLPLIRTIVLQHLESDESVREKQDACMSGSIEWCTILLTGARPTVADKVPFFTYKEHPLQHELSHTLFTLAICHYQRAGALSYKSFQLSNTIPPCSFMQLLPEFAGIESGSSAPAQPVRKFNPLSFVPPTAASTIAPKSVEETARIKAEIIAERKLAVQSLRTAAGIFQYLADDWLKSVPVPRMGRLPDTMPSVSTILSALALTHVQQHTVLSALVTASQPNGAKASPALLAKLCHGIVNKLHVISSTLSSGVGSFYRALEQSFHEFLRLTEEYYSAMRLVYLGVDAELNGKHGRAIGFLTQAHSLLTHTAAVNLSAIRECNPVISELKLWCTLEVTRVQTVLSRLTKDNESIFFDTVVPFSDLSKELDGTGETKEIGVFMASPLPYQPPSMLPAIFLPGATTPVRSSEPSPNVGPQVPTAGLDGVKLQLGGGATDSL